MSDQYSFEDTDFSNIGKPIEDAPSILPTAVGNVGSNGAQAGQALTLSKQSGIPGSVIDADFEGSKDDIQRRQASNIVSSNPVIQNYLGTDPLHAKISHDDYENLQRVTEQAKESTQPSLLTRLWNATSTAAQFGFGEESQFHKDLREQFPKTFAAYTPLFNALEVAARAPGAVIGGLAGLGAQIAQEDPGLGYGAMNPAMAARLERDLGIIGQGAMIEPVMGLAGAHPIAEAQTTAKEAAKPQIRPESAAMLEHGITPPAGFDPIIDEVHTQQAKLDSINLDRMIEARDQTQTHGRSVDAFEDLATKATDGQTIGIPADAIADLYASEKKYPSPDDGLLGWIPDLEAKVKDAQQTGGDVEVSLGGYVARIDSSVHTKLQDFLRLRRDGVSLAEAKDLKETIPTEEPGFDVYHGSPHQFEQFDVGKIGTGEGAQTYGHGLYFAENRKVAEEYQRRLAPEDQTGHIYQTRILAKPEDFLDLDKSLSEQTPEIQAKLQIAMNERQWAEFKNANAKTAIENGFIAFTPESTSAKLKEAGIPGTKYLDQGSRLSQPDLIEKRMAQIERALKESPSDGTPADDARIAKLHAEIETLKNPTRNFVLFHHDLAQIKAINDSPVASAVVKVAEVQSEALHLNPIFTDAKAAGMTEPEFAAYNKKIEARQTAIDEKAISAASKEIKRRQSSEWKANEQTIRQEVQTDTKYNPTLIADTYFRTGQSPNDFIPAGLKLSDQYKRSGLPKEMFTKDGVHPDDVAPLFGFNSGEALLNRLEMLSDARRGNKETPEEHLSRLVDEETARRMESRYGNLDESIRKEAEAAVMGQQQLDILADELRALAKQSGQDFALTKDQLGQMIKDKFDSTSVESLTDSAKLQREVARAGQQVERALLKGKIDDAFKWAQRRLLSFGLAKEAIQFEKEKPHIEKNINDILNEKEIGSVDQTHIQQARAMLHDLGFTGTEPVKEGLKSSAQFVADSNGQIAVAPWMTDSANAPFKGPEDISVKDYRDLGKSLQSIMHVGREQTKIYGAHKEATIDDVLRELEPSLGRFNLIEQPINPSIGQRVKSLGRWLNAWSLLVERMLDYTDKFDPNGPLTSYLDRPLRDSNTKELKLTEATTAKLRALQKYTDNSIMDVIPNDVLPRALNQSGFADLTRGNLRQLMGYMGSKSGIEKITKGFGVAEDVVWKLIHDNATANDWKWVSRMHELFHDLWEESSKMQERDTGVAADPIEAQTMDSKNFGTYPGGYWPLKYDTKTSNIEGHIAAKNPIFDKHYVNAATPQRYTLSRTDFAAPLDLTGQLIGTHIQGMVHDIAFREAVRNASKLINDRRFMNLMTAKWGSEYTGLLHGWLEDIANSHNVDDSYARGGAQISAAIRQNVVSTLTFLNPGTFLKHTVSAAAMSTAAVGAKAAVGATIDFGARGMVQAAKDTMRSARTPRPEPGFADALRLVNDPSPKGDQVRQFILDSSAVMRARNKTAQDTIRNAYEKSITNPTLQTAYDARQLSLQIGRSLVAFGDSVSANPMWYAAYKDSFAKTGEHSDAVFAADRAVSRAHGSGAIMDKSRVMRTGEAMRWVTPLYNFWNHMNANMLQLKWDVGAYAQGRDEPGANLKSITGRFFAYAVIPIIAEEIASAPLDEDKHGLGTKAFLATVRYLGGQYIGIRDLTNAVASGYEPSVGLLGTVTKSLWSSYQDAIRAGEGKKVSQNWLIHAASLLGMTTGIGGTQPGKVISFQKDLATGKERNLTFNQYRQGYRTGHSKGRTLK